MSERQAIAVQISDFTLPSGGSSGAPFSHGWPDLLDPLDPFAPLWESAPPVRFRDFRPARPEVEGRFLWSTGQLYARLVPLPASVELHAGVHLELRPGVLSLYLDPAGDRGGYFEIGVLPTEQGGQLLSRAARRSRSGTRFDHEWQCNGAKAAVDSGGIVTLSLPLRSLGSRELDGKWLIGAAQNDEFAPLRPSPPLLPLLARAGTGLGKE